LTLSERLFHRSQPLHEQTYQALRAAILSGELNPGERLVETQLADKLQVSRTPIREAMRQLQRESLVTTDRNGGLCVTKISIADTTQLYDCRIALEQLSVAGACRNANLLQLKNLEQVLIWEENAIANNRRENSLGALENNTYFHHFLAEISGNIWLVSLLDQILDKISLLRVQMFYEERDIKFIHLEHLQVYEAIARRDSEAAVKAISSHLLASKERVLQRLKSEVEGL
jgi:DNA-binding GntR family transcriptional regulator